MTENKPIMIDGVDVAGCEDYGYRGKAGYWCHNYDEPCTDYPNCYFKQLTRKTQEYEELKSMRDSWLSKCEQETKIKEFYQNELDQLRTENDEYKKMLDNPEVRVALTDIRSGERDLWQKYKSRMEQAEQKLKRIEDYCKDQNLKADYTACVVLQIIDEVKYE